MRRRDLLGFVGSSSLAMMTVDAAKSETDQPREPRAKGAYKDPRTSCFEQCEALSKLCLVIADQLLEELKAGRGDVETIARAHRALVDTHEFCQLAVTTVVRNSPFRMHSCIACADVCERSATIARGAPIEHKEQVVEQFKECAAVCREIAKLA